MTVINTNVGALMARTYATKANDKMQTSMERLSSGMRINSAADDAAGLAVANKMTSQLSGIKMAIRNSQDGISLVQTAEAGMGEITNMILRMRELAVQMENGIYTAKDRDNAQLEVNALLAEIDKIATNTRFNDVAVLDGSYDKTIRAGNTNAETIRVAVGSLKAADTAKIEAHAVEKAFLQEAAGGGVAGTKRDPTDLEVKEGTVVTVDTSLFSSTFKELLKVTVWAPLALRPPRTEQSPPLIQMMTTIHSRLMLKLVKSLVSFKWILKILDLLKMMTVMVQSTTRLQLEKK